jgi:hypothetical protein
LITIGFVRWVTVLFWVTESLSVENAMEGRCMWWVVADFARMDGVDCKGLVAGEAAAVNEQRR